MTKPVTLEELDKEIEETSARLDALKTRRRELVAGKKPKPSEDNRHLFPGNGLTTFYNLLLPLMTEDSGAVPAPETQSRAEAVIADRLRAKILSLPPEQLAWVDAGSFAQMLMVDDAHLPEIIAAATALEGGDDPLLRRFWFLGSHIDPIEVPDEDIALWKAGEGLAHPETGEEIANPERYLNFAWMALKRDRVETEGN